MYYLYILYSETLDKYYIGHSKDVYGRIRRHNTKHKGFTGKATDWKLVYQEIFQNKSEAYARERQIKLWKSRTMIENLCHEFHKISFRASR